MLLYLNNLITKDCTKTFPKSVDFDNYVQHINDFIPDDTMDDIILGEVEHIMGLVIKHSNKVLTQWLSNDERPYNFSESTRNSHSPKPIKDYPGISKLLKLVNEDPRTTQDADAALIAVYNTNKSSVNFHHDGETLIDKGSFISTISFGISRTMEFCKQRGKGGDPYKSEHSFTVSNHDMVIMKPGCQDVLLHRIKPGQNVNEDDGWRISISFRKVTSVEQTEAMEQDSEVSFDTPKSPRKTIARKITVIAGDSFSARLDPIKLGRRRKIVKNLSSGGATISDVVQQLENFYITNTDIVDKIFICVGTNDIRNCKSNGVSHLKAPLIDLIKGVKFLYKGVRIWFQSLVPLPIQHKSTACNVMGYNNILFDICSPLLFISWSVIHLFGQITGIDGK